MSAGVLYLSEVVETTHEEIPDYGPEKFFADIGGAAGLVLGMSVATLAGIIGMSNTANVAYTVFVYSIMYMKRGIKKGLKKRVRP